MTEFNIVLACTALLLLGMGMVKRHVETSLLSEPLLALLAGVLIGPQVLRWVVPAAWELPRYEVLHQTARFSLSMALMAAALRLPTDFFRRHLRGFLSLTGGGMLLMFTVASGCLLLIGFNWHAALLLGAILTPTDPVLATTIVSGSFAEKTVPASLRHLITAESAANDGLAYPLVMLPILFTGAGSPWSNWLLHTLLWENVGAIALGGLFGWGLGRALRDFHRREMLEPQTLLAVTLAASLFIPAAFAIIEMNGIIGVFAAGIACNSQIGPHTQLREERVQSMMERLFVVPVFVLLGTMLPWAEWTQMARSCSPLLWLGLPALLILRRLPVLLLLRPAIPEFGHREALFAGWFGPVGVAAVFYGTLAIDTAPGLGSDLWPLVAFTVAISTIVFALSAYPGTKVAFGE